MGCTDAMAHDPSAPAGHLPGFAREEQGKRYARSAPPSGTVPSIGTNLYKRQTRSASPIFSANSVISATAETSIFSMRSIEIRRNGCAHVGPYATQSNAAGGANRARPCSGAPQKCCIPVRPNALRPAGNNIEAGVYAHPEQAAHNDCRPAEPAMRSATRSSTTCRNSSYADSLHVRHLRIVVRTVTIYPAFPIRTCRAQSTMRRSAVR
jgi:hypothetical protein